MDETAVKAAQLVGLILAWLAVAAVALVFVSILSLPLLERRAAASFEREWEQAFRVCRSRAEVDRVQKKLDALYTSFSLPDGSWVAVAARPACGESSPPDRVVILDSTGKIYVSRTFHFCGYEGLMSDLVEARKTRNLSAFHAKADKLYELSRVPGIVSGVASP